MAVTSKTKKLDSDTVVTINLDGSIDLTVFHRFGHIEAEVSLEPKAIKKLLTFLEINFKK